MNLTPLGTSHKGNHIEFILLCLADVTEHHVLWVRPRCSVSECPLFPRPSNIPVCGRPTLVDHASVSVRLLAAVSRAAADTGLQVSVRVPALSASCVHTAEGLLGHMVTVFKYFRNRHPISHSGHPISHPPSHAQRSQFLYVLANSCHFSFLKKNL